MSFWKKIFGKSAPLKAAAPVKKKVPAATVETPFRPGHSRSTSRPLYHHVPEGWADPNLNTTTNLLRIDAILTMAAYTGTDKPCSAEAEDLLMRKMSTDGGAFQIPLTLTHKTTGLHHAAFYCYTEEEAGYYPYYAREMAKEPGWGESLYFGIVPYAELPQGEETPRPDPIGFIDLFQYEKDVSPPEGNYSLWNRTERECFFANSQLLPILDAVYNRLPGYESFMAGLLMAGWTGREFDGRMALPEEDFNLGLKGPDHTPVIVSFSQRRGILFSMPTSVTPAYRQRLYSHFFNFANALVEMLEKKEGVEKDPEPTEGYPVKWWGAMRNHLLGENQGAHIVGPFQVGDEVAPFPADLPYDPGSIPLEHVLPRIVHTIPQAADDDIAVGRTDPDKPQVFPYLVPLIGDLSIGYAVDRGDHYTYINIPEFEKLSSAEQETLPTRALENLRTVLGQGQGIGIAGAEEMPFHFLTGGHGDYEATTFLLPDFWDKLEPHVGGDMVVAIPSRSHVLITQLTNADGMEAIRGACAQIRTEIPPHRYFDDSLYYRGLGGEWKVVG